MVKFLMAHSVLWVVILYVRVLFNLHEHFNFSKEQLERMDSFIFIKRFYVQVMHVYIYMSVKYTCTSFLQQVYLFLEATVGIRLRIK